GCANCWATTPDSTASWAWSPAPRRPKRWTRTGSLRSFGRPRTATEGGTGRGLRALGPQGENPPRGPHPDDRRPDRPGGAAARLANLGLQPVADGAGARGRRRHPRDHRAAGAAGHAPRRRVLAADGDPHPAAGPPGAADRRAGGLLGDRPA